MWDVGEKLGMERFQIEDLCMGMASQGLLEIKNLSGGMGLTDAGVERVQGLASPGHSGSSGDVGAFISSLEDALTDLGLSETAQKDLAMDIQALRLQLARSKPLPGVQEAVLSEIRRVLEMTSAVKVAPLLDALEQI
jgi:hypothetical protein